MVRKIMCDPAFLAQSCENATKDDLQVVEDLLDTVMKYKEGCVGMAANMIGVRKRIVIVLDQLGRIPTYKVMLNPEIIAKRGVYDAEECCLSHRNIHECTRYRTVTVRFQTTAMETRTETFSGWSAQVVQHVIDHCNGVLV